LFPPPANPKYVMPGYLYAGIIIEGTLLLMVIMLIINRLIFKPIYIPWFFMGKPEKRKEKPSTSFKINLSLKPFTSRSIHTGEDPGKKTMKNDEKPVVSSIDIASLPPVTEAKKRTAEDLNPEPIPTTSDVTIGVSLNNPIVKTGDTRIVSILVESKIELRGARCSLTFDPSLVKCNRVGEGNYFKYWTDAHRGSTQINPQPIIDNDKGLVSDIGIFIKGSPRRGFKGNGVLCYYSFTAIASGTLKPTLSNVSVIDKSGKIFLSEIKSR
jgi:hypothetical protein